jgi:hypothetical protein
MPELNENTQVKTNIALVLKLGTAVISIVLGYSALYHKLKELDVEILRLKDSVDRNTYFSENWPRGNIGSLPDDAEQNMRLTFLEKQMAKHEILLDDYKYGK